MKLTIKQAQARLNAIGVTLKKNEWNEFTINYKGSTNEATKYYTNCLQDALDTGLFCYAEPYHKTA